MSAPILVTRVHIGRGPGIVLVSLSTPAGDLGKGPVENVEAVRVAMTFSTFKEVAELFSATARQLEETAQAAPRRSIRSPEEDIPLPGEYAAMAVSRAKN